ncbi:MAG: response regulator transcription factor [Bacteroidota bacterium]
MPQASILVVEDDLHLGYLLLQLFQDEGFHVRLATDGCAGVELLKRQAFDLCLLDVAMPKMDGFNLAKNLREIRPATPFLFLTARVLKADRLRGYELGAEDYVLKPFDEDELLCKMRVILRRQESKQEDPAIQQFEIGKYRFDYARMELRYEQQTKRLTEKESKVLRQLCLHKNRILRRDDAVEAIYGKKDYFHGRSFDVFISKLRKLLSKDPKVNIENVFKVGFILNVEEA